MNLLPIQTTRFLSNTIGATAGNAMEGRWSTRWLIPSGECAWPSLSGSILAWLNCMVRNGRRHSASSRSRLYWRRGRKLRCFPAAGFNCPMKHLLLKTIAAVVLVGCGPSLNITKLPMPETSKRLNSTWPLFVRITLHPNLFIGQHGISGRLLSVRSYSGTTRTSAMMESYFTARPNCAAWSAEMVNGLAPSTFSQGPSTVAAD